MTRYWCGFEVPDDIPEEHKLEEWPAGVPGAWLTGEGDGYTTWVASVDAESAEAAEAVLRSCFGPSREEITMRWEPRECPKGWEPPKDRFPDD